MVYEHVFAGAARPRGRANRAWRGKRRWVHGRLWVGMVGALAMGAGWSVPALGTDGVAREESRATGTEERAASAMDIRLPEEPYYFYHGLNYGSEALVQPLRLIINGGYGILQIYGREDRITEVHYETGWENVWRNLGNPIDAIEANGWEDFFEREIIPVSFDGNSAHYWPNYTLHLIGGGMSYRLYSEFYRYHHYPRPNLLSGLTMVVYHMLNEVVENNDYEGWTTDPIADLYIFDPLGILLFSSDRVARFFGQTLHMADWSYQPSLNLSNGNLENNGQNFAMKLDIPRLERCQLFYHYGTHGEFGLSYRLDETDSFSWGVGLKASELVDIATGVKGVTLGFTSGVFYDRNNSLLASLLYADTKDYRLRLNLYPGLFRIGPLAPGVFLAERRNEGMVLGVTLLYPPGLPLGVAVDLH